MANPYRPLVNESPEARLLRENAELRAELRHALAGWQRAVNGWRTAEERLDVWMPLGTVAFAAVITLAVSWVAGCF